MKRDKSKLPTIATKPVEKARKKLGFMKLGFLVAGINLVIKLAKGVSTTKASAKQNNR
jgi:hypothetical protein